MMVSLCIYIYISLSSSSALSFFHFFVLKKWHSTLWMSGVGEFLSISLSKKKRERKKAPRPSIVNTHVIFVIEGGLGLVRVTPVFLLLPFLCCVVLCVVCVSHTKTPPQRKEKKKGMKKPKKQFVVPCVTHLTRVPSKANIKFPWLAWNTRFCGRLYVCSMSKRINHTQCTCFSG
jgi:Na+-transporting methylmalonyl-CoA/oxaloacetate decarboxylase gamma subunit